MTFGERLTELRKENGYNSRKELAKKLGIPSTTLRNYETNAREPGHKFLRDISIFFNVSIDYLLCITDKKEIAKNNIFNLQESNIIKKYRKLDKFGKNAVNSILNIEYERCLQDNQPIIIDHYDESMAMADAIVDNIKKSQKKR